MTHREYASAFHVITGHRKTEQHTELDYATLAKLDGTLVFLMSLSNLPAIAASLIQQGKSPDTPAAGDPAGNNRTAACGDGSAF